MITTTLHLMADASVGGAAGAIVALSASRVQRRRDRNDRDDLDHLDDLSSYDPAIDDATSAWVAAHGRDEMAPIIGDKMRLLLRLQQRRGGRGGGRR